MDRRDATALLTALAGGSMFSSTFLLPGCQEPVDPEQYTFFSPAEMDRLVQLADTILPDTPEAPGAKAAGIGGFMDVFVADCLDDEGQQIIRDGLVDLDRRCREEAGKDFLALSADQQHELLVKLDLEAEMHRQEPTPDGAAHYFTLIKGLCLLGYFTSEAGATQALRYVPVPGKYEGRIPYENGDKAWAI